MSYAACDTSVMLAHELCTHLRYRCSSAHLTALSQTSESSTAIISLRPSASFAIMPSAVGTALPYDTADVLQDQVDRDL